MGRPHKAGDDGLGLGLFKPNRNRHFMSTLPGTKSRRRIYLMRHGHVDYLAKHVVASGQINIVPLTRRGRLQAEAAGVALSHVALDRAVCSGYPRTHETASHVLAAQKNP